MFDHIGLHVRDLAASVKFYTAALAPFGYVLGSQDDESASFGPPNAPTLYLLASTTKPTGIHLAFSTAKRAVVDKFYGAGIEAGGRDNGKPGPRADYSPKYYAAFLIDPDGNNIEAVCTA